MARDVEYAVTATDRTGQATKQAARNFEAAQKKMRDDAEKAAGGFGRSLIAASNLAGPKMGAAMTRGIAQAASMAGPLIASAAAYAAPLIAGTLSGAILGGAGIGGVIGGVMLAARDPRVQAAGKDLGQHLMTRMSAAALPHFVTPTLAAIDKIRGGFDKVEGNIQRIFANSSRYVAPLTDGLVAFAQGVIRGFDTLVAKAQPVILAIRDGFEQAGTDVEQFFSTIAGDGQAAAASIRQLFDLFSGALAVLGPIIRALTEINGLLARMGIEPGILQLIARITGAGEATSGFARHTAGATEATDAASASQATYAEQLARATEQVRAQYEAARNAYSATTAAAAATDAATKAVQKNGATLKLNTEAGRANREALSNLANAYVRQYEETVKVNGVGAKSEGVAKRNRDAFIALAEKAGMAAGKARQLATDLGLIPAKKTPKVELLDKATGKINNVINRLAAVKSKTVNLTVAVRQSGDASALRKQNLPAFSASGSNFATDGGSFRTGGPAPVRLASEVNVFLDGTPFRQQIVEVTNAAQRRHEWRARVGAK